MPHSGDPPCVAAHSKSGGAPPNLVVTSAMTAKVGAAASDIHSATPVVRYFCLFSLRFNKRMLVVVLAERGFAGVGHRDPFRIGRRVGNVAIVPVPPFV